MRHHTIRGGSLLIALSVLASCTEQPVGVIDDLEPSFSSHAAFAWKGFNWTVSNASGVVDGADNAVLTRSAAGSATLTVPMIPGINDDGTPWVLFAYVDDATSQQGFDLFINFGSSAARISVGSLFTFAAGFGWERYNVPAIEQPVICVGAPFPGCTPGPGTRIAGVHTVYVGQRADGTVDVNFDGHWFTGTFLKDNSEAPFTFDEIMLRWRDSNSSGNATFVDFLAGDNHPGGGHKDACKKGGWAASGLWKNQGQCVKWANTGK